MYNPFRIVYSVYFAIRPVLKVQWLTANFGSGNDKLLTYL